MQGDSGTGGAVGISNIMVACYKWTAFFVRVGTTPSFAGCLLDKLPGRGAHSEVAAGTDIEACTYVQLQFF